MHRMSKKDILRLQIAVDHFLAVQEHKTAQHLLGEASNELERETPEVVRFDEFVKVHPK